MQKSRFFPDTCHHLYGSLAFNIDVKSALFRNSNIVSPLWALHFSSNQFENTIIIESWFADLIVQLEFEFSLWGWLKLTIKGSAVRKQSFVSYASEHFSHPLLQLTKHPFKSYLVTGEFIVSASAVTTTAAVMKNFWGKLLKLFPLHD